MRKFSFGWAVDNAIDGKRVFRPELGQGAYVVAQMPDSNSKMTAPYLSIRKANNKLEPYTPSQEDIFADNWDCV